MVAAVLWGPAVEAAEAAMAAATAAGSTGTVAAAAAAGLRGVASAGASASASPGDLVLLQGLLLQLWAPLQFLGWFYRCACCCLLVLHPCAQWWPCDIALASHIFCLA